MKVCRDCNRSFPDFARFCPDCGILLDDYVEPEVEPEAEPLLTLGDGDGENESLVPAEGLVEGGETPDETPSGGWQPPSSSKRPQPEPTPVKPEPSKPGADERGGAADYEPRRAEGTAYRRGYGDYDSYSRPRPAASTDTPPRDGKWAPVSLWEYVGMEFLMFVPIVNLVFLFIWACGGAKRVGVRRWAGAKLIVIGIVLVLAIVGVIIAVYTVGPRIIDAFQSGFDFPGYGFNYSF